MRVDPSRVRETRGRRDDGARRDVDARTSRRNFSRGFGRDFVPSGARGDAARARRVMV